jgi:O-succinylbenzoic acid--CoA ligase
VIRRAGEGFVAEDPKVDGWFVTSDRVELAGGGLRILGRADRLVKVLGELVDLEGVERSWREELGAEVAVVTRPDERRGVGLHLFYEGGERDLKESNDARPGLERLAGWTGLKQLPRSALGKIDRAALPKIHPE